MTMSVDMKRAHEKAVEYDKALKSTDSRFANSVLVRHEDGSIFFVRDAFAVEWVDEKFNAWIFVFAEHYDLTVFVKSEVDVQMFSSRLPVEKMS